MGCGIGCRLDLDPALLWLWCRPAVVALIRPLAWELPYATGVALKIKIKKKTLRIFLRPYGVVCTILGVLLFCPGDLLPYLFFTAILRGMSHYYLHFTDRKTEAGRNKMIPLWSLEFIASSS